MDTGTEVEPKKRTRGRKDNAGQEAIAKRKPVDDKIEYLVKLFHAHATATSELSEAIKAVAEKSDLNAAVVRKYVAAKAGDKFEDKQREVGQLAFIFDTGD